MNLAAPLRWLLAVVLVASGATTACADGWPKTWMSKGLTSHPLVGKIYAPHAKKFVTPKDYLRALAWPRFVLLGEVHDNPDHHILQALALKYVGGGKLSAVFEHFQSNQQVVIDAFLTGGKQIKSSADDDPVDRLFLVTGWANSGWPDSKIYRPLIAAVLDRKANILAGNVPKRRVIEVARKGSEALSTDARRRLMLDKPLGRGLDDELLSELEANHCGLMPKSAFGNMAVAQRFRDGNMARVMTDATMKDGPVVLLAGNGHVRVDRGVPWYLRRMLPKSEERPLISVGHVEVVEGRIQPSDYAKALAAYSLIVFTPRTVRTDPCVAMRKRFGKHKRK
jgi:uncharacterized iron-regulated protein